MGGWIKRLRDISQFGSERSLHAKKANGKAKERRTGGLLKEGQG